MVVVLLFTPVGGSPKMRKYWTEFVEGTDILVFVVDSTGDRESLVTAGAELKSVLSNPRMENVPTIIVANKQVGTTGRTEHLVHGFGPHIMAY